MNAKIQQELKDLCVNFKDNTNYTTLISEYYLFGITQLTKFVREKNFHSVSALKKYISVWLKHKAELLSVLLNLESVVYQQVRLLNPFKEGLTSFFYLIDSIQNDIPAADFEILKTCLLYRNKYAHSTGFRNPDELSVLKQITKLANDYLAQIVAHPLTVTLDANFEPKYAEESKSASPIIYQKDADFQLLQEYEGQLLHCLKLYNANKKEDDPDFKTYLFYQLGTIWKKREDFIKVICLFSDNAATALLDKDVLPLSSWKKVKARTFKQIKGLLVRKMTEFYKAFPRASYYETVKDLAFEHHFDAPTPWAIAYFLAYDLVLAKVDSTQYYRFKNYFLNLYHKTGGVKNERELLTVLIDAHKLVSTEFFDKYCAEINILAREYKMAHPKADFKDFLAQLNWNWTQEASFVRLLAYKFI